MDEVERLIEVFRTHPTAPVFWKLDVLMDLEHVHDARVVRFLLRVLEERREPAAVLMRVVRLARTCNCPPETRASVARALMDVLTSAEGAELRVDAALALAEYTDVHTVPAALGALASNAAESLDLRYSAFTSLQRTGPTAECADLLRRLLTDEALGLSARSVLASWQLQ